MSTYVGRLRRRYTAELNDPGTVDLVSSFSTSVDTNPRPTFGPNVSNYRQVIYDRQNATTSLVISGLKVRLGSEGKAYAVDTVPHSTYYRKVESEDHLGLLTDVPGLPAWSSDQADNLALMQFNRHAQQAQTQLQGLVVLGEMKETLHLILGAKRTLVGLVTRHIKEVTDYAVRATRRMPRNVRIDRATRIVSDSWLQAVFGWQPLISDIEDGMIASYRIANEARPSVLVRGRGQQAKNNPAVVLDWSSSFDFFNIVNIYDDREIADVKYYGVVLLETGLTGAQQRLGLQWSDVIPAVWELIPYSFVVDYFTNIGEVIAAASFTRNGVSWVAKGDYIRTTRTLQSTTFRLTSVPFPDIVRVGQLVPPIGFSLERYQKRRGAYYGSLIPSLVFTIPGFRQGANLTALAATYLTQKNRIRSHLGS